MKKPIPKYILAISGGPDSVYLLHRLLKEGHRPVLAHVNHQLRGKDSDEDEQFIQDLATQHDLTLEIKRVDVKAWATKHKKSLEEAGRIIRYEFLENIRTKHNAEKVLTAHHLNDNLESVLMNQIRGCDLKGEIGMVEKRGNLERPLLNISKKEILHFLTIHQIPYRIDATNKDQTFKRNHVRHTLIPKLLEENPHLLETFKTQRNAAIKAYKKLKEETIDWLKEYNFSQSHQFPTITFKKLSTKKRHFFLQYIYQEIHGSTQNLTRKWIVAIDELIKKNITGKQHHFGENCLVKIEYGNVYFNSTKSSKSNPPQLVTLVFNAKRIPNGLIQTREWTPGDRFQPSGMKGTKKVQDFFTDNKTPRLDRSKIPILTTQDNQIIAVGTRLDERYKASPSSPCLEFTIKCPSI